MKSIAAAIIFIILMALATWLVKIILSLLKSKANPIKQSTIELPLSKFRFTVFINNKSVITVVHENNRIDEAAYYVYQNYADKLGKLNIFIKRNEDNQILKIVKDSDSESMIGVSHPIDGHIGYLTVEEVGKI